MSATLNCLAIETATAHCSVAACAGERSASVELTDPRASSRQLYHAVGEVLARVGLTPAQLDCVAFGCGPGSFTGVRIAAAAAQSIAFAQSLPVCRISTLAAMAVAAGSAGKPVAVCLDARQGEVYFGVYGWDAQNLPVALQPDGLVRPSDLQFPLASSPILGVGNGWAEWPELRARLEAQSGAVRLEVWPNADALLFIARAQFARGDVVTAADAIPNYLRNRVTQ
jgi:tRNA threonylcarbamoyladenosine biosynthesis protein TsaB